jgi:perosamine synthetase
MQQLTRGTESEARGAGATPVARGETAAIARRWRHQPPAYAPLPFAAPLAAVAGLLRSSGDPRARLRQQLTVDHGAAHVTLCGSGTQALLLACRLASRRRQGQLTVALPAYSCYDVAAAAVAAGVRVRLYDIEPESLAPALDSLESALRAGAEVVVVAHLFGLPVDWRSVATLCTSFGATLIEDAAQGFGASWEARPLGSLGELAVLSFGRGKGWTGGRGGALLAHGPWAQIAPTEPLRPAAAGAAISTAALAVALALLNHPAIYRLPASLPWLRLGETIYRPVTAPAELSATAAVLAARSREAAEREVAVRRRNAAMLLGGLRGRPGFHPIVPVDGSAPAYLRLPVRLRGGLAALGDPHRARWLGIAPGYPAPLSALAPLRAHMVQSQTLPGAAELARTLITLPTHSRLRDDELSELLRLVNSE